MSGPTFLKSRQTALLLVDVQERLCKKMWQSEQFLESIQLLVRAWNKLELPLFVTEQYPEGLGHTEQKVSACFVPKQPIYEKTTFSALRDPHIRYRMLSLPFGQWVLAGLEAHVCILQTAKDLVIAGKEVTVLKDAVSSRREGNLGTALQEIRSFGGRVTSVETALFELLEDANAPQFKDIHTLIK